MAEIVDQAVIRLGLFDRVEILALDILDERDLESLGIAEFAYDDGHFVEPCTLRCSPASLASHDLIALAMRPHDDRLDQPTRSDRFGEFLESRFTEMTTWLARMRRQRADRQ